jgi:hypothetical protein
MLECQVFIYTFYTSSARYLKGKTDPVFGAKRRIKGTDIF